MSMRPSLESTKGSQVLTITISGAPNSGKTTLARALERFLESQGVRIINRDPDIALPSQILSNLSGHLVMIEVKPTPGNE
jgi:adenylylsulfate kinase-like enzyme